jgi:anti-sigma regulatory factor (Ser/Thr protein kinase)
MCWAAEEGFASDARTPSMAREFVSSHLLPVLELARDDDPMSDIELVVSELVTNAVRAGAQTVQISLNLHHRELEVQVADDGPGWPRLVQPTEREPHGRGLLLVDALADQWHAERLAGGGKRVIVTVGLPVGATSALSCERPRFDLVERES